MQHDVQAYGLWGLVFINSAIFIIFAFSFTKPQAKRDWRSFGAFSAFIVALFTEMYGIPLTIYFLSGWLSKKFPQIDPLSHDAGHLWYTIFGLSGNPHTNPVHLISNLLVLAGFFLLASAWKVLYPAQRDHKLATEGPYAHVRHPQYDAFIIIIFGFLLMWPTLLALVMFPVLIYMYIRLARSEENEAIEVFGDAYQRYASKTPAFLPKWRKS